MVPGLTERAACATDHHRRAWLAEAARPEPGHDRPAVRWCWPRGLLPAINRVLATPFVLRRRTALQTAQGSLPEGISPAQLAPGKPR
jgi:hypothetical protein